ncbi:MAG: hypothetical protein QOI34_1676 [Verrucomicrobiota bacterium]
MRKQVVTVRIGVIPPAIAFVVVCSALLMMCSCETRRAPSLTGAFSGTLEIDPVFRETVRFGHRINLIVALRNPRSQPVVFRNLRFPTSWKNAKRGSGSSSGGGETFTLEPNTRRFIYCTFYVGPDIDHVDPMRFTRVQFVARGLGADDMSFERGDGEIDFTVNAQFSIEAEDSGQITLARYRIDPRKNRATPYFVARDLQMRMP